MGHTPELGEHFSHPSLEWSQADENDEAHQAGRPHVAVEYDEQDDQLGGTDPYVVHKQHHLYIVIKMRKIDKNLSLRLNYKFLSYFKCYLMQSMEIIWS